MSKIVKFENIERVLKKFNIATFDDSLGGFDSSQFEKYEELIGISIPDDYKYYLSKYGKYNTYLDSPVLYKGSEKNPWSDESGFNSFDFLLGAESENNIFKIYEMYNSQLPEEIVPIATSEGGNLLCIGIKGDYRNKIFFWDHESVESKYHGIYIVSNSFEEFINILVYKEETVSNVESKIEDSWFDPDLFD